MSREHKYRVYSFLDKCFHYFTIYEGVPQGIAGGLSEPQQYTGLTDKNKNLIYEGDIVKYNPDKPNIERIGIIEFSNYYKGWSIKDSHCYPLSDFGVYSLASPFLSFNWTEIVGNIFEHENLLK
jgi:uncharacterized phage protein (TIGR01671 family)